MDKIYVKDEYLEIELNNGDLFSGYFKSQKSGSITLNNVKELPKGEVAPGRFTYYSSEVKAIRRVEIPENDQDITKKLVMLKLTNEEIEKLACVSKKFIFINQVDDEYKNAIIDLNLYSYLAVGTDGSSMGRNCKLPLLTISTPTQIYIFDLKVLQPSVVNEDLKSILESNEIKKIIHNSKKLSDCLFHRHYIKLTNVYDTQVADIVIYKNKYGYFPEGFKTLEECLDKYLGIKEEFSKVDIVEWSKRPVTVEIKETASHNILYLHKLSEILHEEMLAPFTRGVEYFVNHLRNNSDYDAWQLNRSDKQLTEDFKIVIGTISHNEVKNKD